MELDSRQPDVFEDFYRRQFSSLAVLATAVTGDASTGEDLAQEALERARSRWETITRYDDPAAWSRRVVINLSLNRRRRLANETKALLRLVREPAGRNAGPTLHGDLAVWEAVASLPMRQRTVVALHYLEDCPVAEIADLLGISVSTATSTLHQARKRLAETLTDKEAEQ
ncbi:MAG: sigma-70 family RNA polymerase sigma factor [Acidimicrobiales bacterium]